MWRFDRIGRKFKLVFNAALILVMGIVVLFFYLGAEHIDAPRVLSHTEEQAQGKVLPEEDVSLIEHHRSTAQQSTPETNIKHDKQIALPSSGGEKISFFAEKKISSGSTEWISSFDVEVDSHAVFITTKISLLPSKGVRSHTLEENKKTWRKAINAIWNGRFYLSDGSTKIPIMFNVRFTHHKPHQQVIVRSGDWVPNQHNWYINTPPLVIAHEIGHMFGAFDEYKGGALSPEKPIVDTMSIMGSKPDIGAAHPRHLLLLEKILAAHFKNEGMKITIMGNAT